MKIILTFFLFISILSFSAQEPVQYPLENANWSVVNAFPTGGWSPDTAMVTLTYGYDGVKELGGYIYSQLYQTHEPVLMPGDQNTYLNGYVREENGYVLYLNIGQEVADTLYNFNLQPGDVATNFRFCCATTYPMTLNTIDSVLINEEYRKRFIFDTVWDYTSSLAEVWIEGIGSIHGPTFPNTARLFSSEVPDQISLNCFSHESQIIWQNPEFDQCYMNTLTSISELENHQLLIYPNPASSYFSVLPDPTVDAYEVRIHSLAGSLIRSETINIRSSQTMVSLVGIRPGMYFVELIGNGKRNITKLIKK